jgi:AcrR family transcriptional regulator
MAAGRAKQGRARAVQELKRGLILDAARKVFEVEGLDGASLRAIAAEAGYTPAALYFHFDSKEAIYAEVLQASLASLSDAVGRAVMRSTRASRPRCGRSPRRPWRSMRRRERPIC